jgi:hypothetical protein
LVAVGGGDVSKTSATVNLKKSQQLVGVNVTSNKFSINSIEFAVLDTNNHFFDNTTT